MISWQKFYGSFIKNAAYHKYIIQLMMKNKCDKGSCNKKVKQMRQTRAKGIPLRIEYEKSIPSDMDSNEMKKEPCHWRNVYKNIQEMRSNRDAPVDTMGAEKCSDEEVDPSTFRFQTLVSLMLSSQTKDNVTYAAMTRLRNYGLTIANILRTSEKDLQNLIYPVGFYKRKAEYIKRTSQILQDKYSSDIPQTVEELCSLPGVGKKMAYLCMDIAWDLMEGIGVDTHVHRICNRTGWTLKPTKTPEETRKALEDWLPKEHWREINLLLVGFGQQICLPINPKCSECLNQKMCPYGSSHTEKVSKKRSLPSNSLEHSRGHKKSH